MNEPIKILILEDVASDAELAEREIRKTLPNCTFKRVATEKEYLEALHDYNPDLVLADYSLPSFDGKRALNLTREYSPFTPVIIWTGSISEETAVDCMKLGAANYVMKENRKRLGMAVIHALEEKKIKLERKEQDEKLNAVQAQLKATLDAIPDLLFELGLSGKYYDYHSPRTELLSIPADEMIGKTIFDVIPLHAVESVISALTQANEEKFSNGKQFELNLPIGKRWFELSVSQKPTNENDEPRFIVLSRDITDRKKHEQERELLIAELMQNNNDLLQFSYIISHNLRAPLSNLLGLLTLLEDTEIQDEYIRLILEGFKTSTQSLSRTLKDLNEIIVIKKQPSIKQENINVMKMVESILGQINNLIIEIHPNIKINFDKAPIIYFNRAYLESIILNLFTNAIRFRDSNRGLDITISTELENDKPLLIFSDNGIGIDVNRYKDRLFGLYQKFHDHSESKGFGLYLIKSQIESLGGSIEIESEVNIGTKFLIKFPRR